MKVQFAPYHSRNPYQDLLAGHLADLGVDARGCGKFFLLSFFLRRSRILHLHWLHPFSVSAVLLTTLKRLVRAITQLLMLRFLGVKIVWTVHNLRNHENLRPAFDSFFSTFVAKLADVIIVHGEAAKEAVIETFGRRCAGKILVIPHGNYVGVYPNTASRKDARRELDLPQRGVVILFFGALRTYKGVLELIKSFKRLPHHIVDSASLPPSGEVPERSIGSPVGILLQSRTDTRPPQRVPCRALSVFSS